MNSKNIVKTFPNGLKAVTSKTDGHVSYIGIVVNAGSRDEGKLFGLAHFVEHTLFKGTRKRSSWHISNRMESVGGELNAYTSKEETVVYIAAPEGNVARSVELLADLVANSTFPANELAKEKDVVNEEIMSYLDSPSESVYDDFEDLVYAGSGLAHNILGSSKSLESISGADCRHFVESYYVPSNMSIYCVDSGDPEKNMRIIERFFGALNIPFSGHDRVHPQPLIPFNEHKDLDIHQANTIAGTRMFSRTDPRRFSLFLLNNYLGGPCMNSRLNNELREKRGYVYTVDSMVTLLSDTGLFLVYFACDKDYVQKCLRIINNELDALAQSPISQNKFEKIKRQYCGQLILTGDHRESNAMNLGKSLLYFDEIVDIATTAEKINLVTPEEMMETARLIMSSPLSVLSLS